MLAFGRNDCSPSPEYAPSTSDFVLFCSRSLRAHQLVPGLRWGALAMTTAGVVVALMQFIDSSIFWHGASLAIAGLMVWLGRALSDEAFSAAIGQRFRYHSYLERLQLRLGLRDKKVREYLVAQNALRIAAVEALTKCLEARLRREVACRVDLRSATSLAQAVFTGTVFWLTKAEFDAGRVDSAVAIVLLACTVAVGVVGLSFMAPLFTPLLRSTEIDIEEGLEALLDARLQMLLEQNPAGDAVPQAG